MIVSTKVMDALKTIGLNLYERKLWTALLAKGTAAAGELSQMSNVPRSRTYDTLESLAEKGFVMVQSGKPVKFVAIKPDEALEMVKKKIEADTEEMKKRLDDLKKSSMTRELSDLFGKGLKTIVPEELTGTIKGRTQMSHQMSSMIRGASKSIHIVTSPDGLRELSTNHFDNLKKAKSRGVDVRIASMVNDNCRDAAKSLGSVASVKSFDANAPVKGNFVVIDGSELMFSLTEQGKVHDTQHVAVWSRSEHAASDVMGPLFKMIWDDSKSV